MQTKKYIILYASTSSVDENINSPAEYKAIHEAVDKYDHINLLKHLENVTPETLHYKLDEVIANKPNDSKIIFQLAGHSDRTGFFLPNGFEEEPNDLKVKPSTLQKYFGKYREHIECIIFSSCSSVKLAEAVFIIDKLVCSIGTNVELDTNLSIEFTKDFYQKFRATNHDFYAALNYAKNGQILRTPADLFWGACKQNNLLHSLIAEESQSIHLKTIRELQKHLSDVIDFGATENIDKNLFEQIKSTIHSIDKTKAFTCNFGNLLEIEFNYILKPHDKIQIFTLQKKFIFEYALLLTREISQLLKDGLIDKIPDILQDLIDDYKLNLDFNFNEVIGIAEKIRFLKEKRREIYEVIKRMQNQEIKEAEMYIKIYDLIRLLTENQPIDIIETVITTQSDFNERIKEISQPFAKIKEGYIEYKNSVINIIPNHLLQ